MKSKSRIFFLVLLLLILIPGISAECFFEPGRTVCYEERTEVYNTSIPTIIVDFQELPVYREEINLKSWDTNENKPLDILSELQSYFEYRSRYHLPNGKFEFYMRAHDTDNNLVEMHVNFTIQASMMDLYVSKPVNKHIIKPKFAVGDNTTYYLELKLQRPGKCRYNIFPFSGNLSQQTYDSLPHQFIQSTTDPTINYNSSFNMASLVTGYQYDGDLRTLYMICKEDGDNRFNYAEIEVGADLYPPEISAEAIPSPVVNVYSKKSNITITTDDLSVCTIENIDYPTCNDCSPIIPIRGPGFDFTLRSQFNYTYEEELLIPVFNSNYNYVLNLTCDNMANRQSSILFTLPVEYSQTQGVTFLSPPSLINKTAIDINVSVTFGDDVCDYTFNRTISNSWKPLTFSGNYINGEAILTASATAKEGLQSIFVRCQSFVGEVEHQFRVDTTKPLVPNVTIEANTCSLNILRAEVEGLDANNGSGISRFHYNITLDDNPQNYEDIIYGTTQHIISESIDGDLYENLTYTVKVWAEDNAGNIGPQSAAKKIKVTDDGINACDYSDPSIHMTYSQDNETKEWEVKVNCTDVGSGCKGTFGYSIHTNTSQECSFSTTKNLMDPISIKNSSKFCAIVFDNNNNNKSTTKMFEVVFPATCFDGVENGDETGIDCGGSCPKCDINVSCTKNSDCESNYCLAGICTEPSCTDGIRNGLETGIDCGGDSFCGPCAINQGCVSDNDCVTGNCQAGICSEASCDDGKKDGMESDIDCGGPDCEKCPSGALCVSKFDCETNYCGPEGYCTIDPLQDTDGDGLPDVWEIEHCGCATCCDPNEDLDGDRYTNLEEFEYKTDPNDPNDVPPFHKLNPISLILLIIGGLSLLGGIGLLIYENEERKKREATREQKRMMESMSTIPKLLPSIKKEPPKRTFSEEEIKKRQELRRKASKLKTTKRRRIFDEFDMFGKKPEAKPVEEKPQPQKSIPKPTPKPVIQKEVPKTEKAQKKDDDVFSKLSDLSKKEAKEDSGDVFEKLKNLTKNKKDKK